jgi:hypothetical protein
LRLLGTFDNKSDLDTVSVTVNTGTITPPITNQILTRVEIVDANGLAISSFGIEPGKTKQFTARSYDQNNQDITNKTSFLWSIDGKYSTSQVGNVTQTGLFTSGPKAGLYSGALRLLGDFAGKALLDTVTVNINTVVQPNVLTSVAISPTTATLEVGHQRQFTATAYDQNGSVINSGVTFQWNVTNSQAGGITQTGLFTADNHLGTYNNVVKVTATRNSVSKSTYASVTVTQSNINQNPVLNSVVINPTYTTLQTGHSQQFTATAYDQFGQVFNANFSWAVVNGGGTINQTGWFTAGSQTGTYQNTVRVTARPSGASSSSVSKSAYATVVVVNQVINQSVLDRVELTPSYANILINQQTDFNAQAYDNNNTLISSGVTYYWSVISGPGSINQNGLFSADGSTGTATVQVRASQGGIDRYALATVYVSENGNYDNEDISYVRITPSSAYLNPGSAIDFDAQAYDYNGHAVSATYTWDLMNSIGTLNQSGYFVANSNASIGTYNDAVRVRAYHNGIERNDYADVIISSSQQTNYGLTATLSGTDENGGTTYEGDLISYVLRLNNNSGNTLTNVNATFELPTYTTLISATSADGTPTSYNRTITWNAGTMYSGTVKTVTIRVKVNANVPSNTVLRAKANIWASEITSFWVYANDIYVAGTGAIYNDVPLTNTGALSWGLAGLMSLIATVVTRKWLFHLMF